MAYIASQSASETAIMEGVMALRTKATATGARRKAPVKRRAAALNYRENSGDMAREFEAILTRMDERAKEIEATLLRIEAEKREMLAEAKGAAAMSGSAVAAQMVSDLARRIGVLEERTRTSFPATSHSKLAPPENNRVDD
jgi:hypothetical protein